MIENDFCTTLDSFELVDNVFDADWILNDHEYIYTKYINTKFDHELYTSVKLDNGIQSCRSKTGCENVYHKKDLQVINFPKKSVN